jgi:hypothetical protein
MVQWEYTYHMASIKNVGVKALAASNLGSAWDENGYSLWNDHQMSVKNDGKTVDLINKYGQDGWELVSITPVNFLIEYSNIAHTMELLLTFKKPIV